MRLSSWKICRASERNGHREPRGRQDDSHGRERSRKETPMDDSRDRQKLAAARQVLQALYF